MPEGTVRYSIYHASKVGIIENKGMQPQAINAKHVPQLANRLRVRKASIDFQQAPSPTTTGTTITKAFLKIPLKDTLKQSIIVNVGGGGDDHQKIQKKTIKAREGSL
jgi:hypothetical protein